MRRMLIIFMGLLTVFFSTWGVKAQTPSSRPEGYEDEESIPWYQRNSSAPIASDDWYLDPEIPINYIPVPGEDELYMVVDDSGNIICYRQREQLDDGTWVWKDVNPDIPDDYEAVPGLENVYKVTDADGNVSYFLYVRNDNDTFCFVPCDENGVPLDDGSSAETIDDDHVWVTDNTYALYNEDGVLEGYRERVQDSDGNYVWKVVGAPDTSTASVGNGQGSVIVSKSSGYDTVDMPSLGTSANEMQVYTNGGSSGSGAGVRTENSDGTYTLQENTIYTSEEDGYTVTYQETVYSTYSSDGTLISTKKEGPYEVSRTASSSTPSTDRSVMAATLDAELSRVSAYVSYDTQTASEVLASLNAERAAQGVGQLTMNTNSTAYKVACIRAADMAIYGYSSSTSPLYGTLTDLLSTYGVAASAPSENVWRGYGVSASDIHTKFQADEGSRKVRMSSGYSEVGIAVVQKDGQVYVAEVYLGN